MTAYFGVFLCLFVLLSFWILEEQTLHMQAYSPERDGGLKPPDVRQMFSQAGMLTTFHSSFKF